MATIVLEGTSGRGVAMQAQIRRSTVKVDRDQKGRKSIQGPRQRDEEDDAGKIG